MTLKTKAVKAGRSKRAKAVKELTPTELFFYDHAGYSYGPNEKPEDGRIRCAKELSEAESIAARKQWSYAWEWDDSGCSGCDCKSPECKCSTGEEHETLGCILLDEHGKHMPFSLWGICGATNDYRRVVEAELASEALEARKQEREALRASVQHMNDSEREEL
jgi:hypothetical protein